MLDIHRSDRPDPKSNLVLAALQPADYDALMREADIVHLKFGRSIHAQNEPIDNVFFPLTAVVSLLVALGEQAQVELAIVGFEGVTGATELLEAQGAMGLYLVQAPGEAVQISSAAFRRFVDRRPQVIAALHTHLFGFARQILRSGACNQFHNMEERCARWLLMMHDRARQDTFPITQEFLSKMLGVRRATVNVATGLLKKAGFIRYVRGLLTVVDRPGLESAACECYRDIARVYAAERPRSAGGVPAM